MVELSESEYKALLEEIEEKRSERRRTFERWSDLVLQNIAETGSEVDSLRVDVGAIKTDVALLKKGGKECDRKHDIIIKALKEISERGCEFRNRRVKMEAEVKAAAKLLDDQTEKTKGDPETWPALIARSGVTTTNAVLLSIILFLIFMSFGGKAVIMGWFGLG